MTEQERLEFWKQVYLAAVRSFPAQSDGKQVQWAQRCNEYAKLCADQAVKDLPAHA